MIGAAAETRLHDAIDNRDIIGQPKGILMQRMDITGIQVFALLTRMSQDSNTELVDIARGLVDRHESELENRSTTGLS